MERPPPGEIASLRALDKLADRLEFANQIGNNRLDAFRLRQAIAKTGRIALRAQGFAGAELERLAPVLTPPPLWRGMPTTEDVKILAVLIEFQDRTHVNSRDTIHDNLFGSGDSARSPYESVAVDYDRASYQKLDLTAGETLGWYQTANDRSDVPQTDTGREDLIKEALDHFDAQGHDFSRYDNNNDGVIDYFIVIWTGPDNGWANFWWGYQTSFQDQTYSLDGVTLGKYSWQWESRPVGSAFTPTVVIHETGHALGLPDYYDYLPVVGPEGGVGGLDIGGQDPDRTESSVMTTISNRCQVPSLFGLSSIGFSMRKVWAKPFGMCRELLVVFSPLPCDLLWQLSRKSPVLELGMHDPAV